METGEAGGLSAQEAIGSGDVGAVAGLAGPRGRAWVHDVSGDSRAGAEPGLWQRRGRWVGIRLVDGRSRVLAVAVVLGVGDDASVALRRTFGMMKWWQGRGFTAGGGDHRRGSEDDHAGSSVSGVMSGCWLG